MKGERNVRGMLVAIDHSPATARVLAAARDLAWLSQGEVWVVHVREHQGGGRDRRTARPSPRRDHHHGLARPGPTAGTSLGQHRTRSLPPIARRPWWPTRRTSSAPGRSSPCRPGIPRPGCRPWCRRLARPVTSFQHSFIVSERGTAAIWGHDASSQAGQIIGQVAHPSVRDELRQAASDLGFAAIGPVMDAPLVPATGDIRSCWRPRQSATLIAEPAGNGLKSTGRRKHSDD